MPNLSRLDPSIRFYINIYCSEDGMGAVLIQADVSAEAIKSEAQEKDVEKCEFDKSLEGMRLRPIYFISRSTASPTEK